MASDRVVSFPEAHSSTAPTMDGGADRSKSATGNGWRLTQDG
jgi:hypothetical protein